MRHSAGSAQRHQRRNSVRIYDTLVDRRETKKANVAEYPEIFDHVGLLLNGPPERCGLLFIESSDNIEERSLETQDHLPDAVEFIEREWKSKIIPKNNGRSEGAVVRDIYRTWVVRPHALHWGKPAKPSGGVRGITCCNSGIFGGHSARGPPNSGEIRLPRLAVEDF